ncbi:DUF4124 domain-containing protein [Niveibacterium sp.]|uniref:DUF4124 domain-containing protein n=1 Tax=Niveibacterium sp. TaxID=2017444 RepID=UPI0035B198E4
MTARLRALFLLLPLLFAAAPSHAADEVFKWRDEKGRWQYGNQPPPGVKAERVNATISTVPAYKPKPLGGLPRATETTEAPAADGGAPPVTSASRQQMMDACEQAGGTDCDAIVNAALNASVGQAATRRAGSGASSGAASSASTPSGTPKPTTPQPQ